MDEQSKIRLDKLEKIREIDIEPYPYAFKKSHSFREINAQFKESSEDELKNISDSFRVAGRIMAIRNMGKSAFLQLFDGDEKLQIYIRKDQIPVQDFLLYKLLDIADIIGVEGTIFKTRTGELTILVSGLTFLTKSLHPLPEKWHGLQDKELRYRQRYLDFIVNDKPREIFKLRSQMIQKIRLFFYDHEYTEVETPMMHAIPGGASARPFVTHHNALNADLYLRIAPELYLKRLLVGGMEKIFEINRNFRNEGISLMHNPEFTMIEFYELYQDFNHYMELTEKLFQTLNDSFLTEGTITWGDETISLSPPFDRKKFMDLVSEKTGLPIETLWQEDQLARYIKDNMKTAEIPPTFGKKLDLLFDQFVEPTLVKPTFVTYYPLAISPLSKKSRQDPRETERFELFIAGMEIANGFSELNDPLDQKQRFEMQQLDREKGDEEAQWIDQDFIKALEYGMPPAAGEGLGIDRLVMLYSGTSSIKEVILFPQLRPKE